MVMTPNLVPIYACAVLTILILCLFARQNQKSGWKRNRTESIEDGLREFFAQLGVSTDEQVSPPVWKPLDAEETIGFSAQMLRLRSALGTGSPVTQGSAAAKRELAHQ